MENTLVVNLGEMLQLATRGYYLATPHRVLLPEPRRSAEYGTSTARVSASRTSGTRGWSTCEPMDLPPSGAVDARGRADGGALRAAARRLKRRKRRRKRRTLLEAYGANALKSLARSHPEVMARHHPDLVVGEDGAVARRTSARAYRE